MSGWAGGGAGRLCERCCGESLSKGVAFGGEGGASGVLLAPVTYQALTDDEVHGLFEDVTAELSVPLIVYDNPGRSRPTSRVSAFALAVVRRRRRRREEQPRRQCGDAAWPSSRGR